MLQRFCSLRPTVDRSRKGFFGTQYDLLCMYDSAPSARFHDTWYVLQAMIHLSPTTDLGLFGGRTCTHANRGHAHDPLSRPRSLPHLVLSLEFLAEGFTTRRSRPSPYGVAQPINIRLVVVAMAGCDAFLIRYSLHGGDAILGRGGSHAVMAAEGNVNRTARYIRAIGPLCHTPYVKRAVTRYHLVGCLVMSHEHPRTSHLILISMLALPCVAFSYGLFACGRRLSR